MDVIKVISYRVFFYWSRPKSVEDYKIPIQKMESEANFHFFVMDFTIFNTFWAGPIKKPVCDRFYDWVRASKYES